MAIAPPIQFATPRQAAQRPRWTCAVLVVFAPRHDSLTLESAMAPLFGLMALGDGLWALSARCPAPGCGPDQRLGATDLERIQVVGQALLPRPSPHHVPRAMHLVPGAVDLPLDLPPPLRESRIGSEQRACAQMLAPHGFSTPAFRHHPCLLSARAGRSLSGNGPRVQSAAALARREVHATRTAKAPAGHGRRTHTIAGRPIRPTTPGVDVRG